MIPAEQPVHERGHPVARTATIHNEDTTTRPTELQGRAQAGRAAAHHHDIEEFRWLIHGTKSADVLAALATVRARMA